ncbi:hypothetical protein PILCRDRAFT_695551 [Piloderma croceum F 1598]|uniref:Uncharacterized protein n=1 Tax=Piloderma croceum (strain F 1598) TaxID=765440 RepID=A0A0C3F4B7_PILCF|nr:hypothetical protein PILCRDRAFT_695551 [Piloderma croceum F 1598]
MFANGHESSRLQASCHGVGVSALCSDRHVSVFSLTTVSPQFVPLMINPRETKSLSSFEAYTPYMLIIYSLCACRCD